MEVDIASRIEQGAVDAESYDSFGSLNLLHIKRQVAKLLGLIGRHGLFDEYTHHDISHVNEMLKILDWIIPEETWSIMTPADCLIATLSIYFHDLGMLVTRQEFERRNESDFPNFRDNFLFAGSDGTDYRKQMQNLQSEDLDRFLYQEFVRHNHATRVKNWIVGRPTDHLGVSQKALSEVVKLMTPLSKQFRRDLALVCESHHLNDLGDIDKYKVDQPYGNSDSETANLQYAAVLLRTCDLLHITRDRTPSIEYRVISPLDPISQLEWAKQMGVNRVKPKMGVNKEGLPDEDSPKDTVAVYAFFTTADAFFGLTSYLTYAQDELAKSSEWIGNTHRLKLAPYEFPWRWIDESQVEADGFLRDTFEFNLDQARILDLLTGHTLYNDSRVVLRELVQNSLDAIRLQQRVQPGFQDGRVAIHWDNEKRVLSVLDNGTGMTQRIITKFLLTVGSSRYQDEEFRKQYPDFAPISRFGIGVLSAFMIADTVDIVTCNQDEDDARHLSLRSVHGKYLIRLLDKATDPLLQKLKPHGTIFSLRVRHSAVVPDFVKTALEWIVIPGCEVTIQVDDGELIQVGFDSVDQVLRSQLSSQGFDILEEDETITDVSGRKVVKIIEREIPGLSLAYAVTWNRWFREWTFLTTDSLDTDEQVAIGTCIGGIRVESASPGYTTQYLVAVVNAHGLEAPTTNVARYGLDDSPKRDRLLSNVYSLYCKHIADEIERLRHNGRFSLTWSTQEGQYLLGPLINIPGTVGGDVSQFALLKNAARMIPLAVVEFSGTRRAISISELHSYDAFWTIESALFRSMEWFLREFPQDSSLRTVANAVKTEAIDLPSEPLLCHSVPTWGVHGRYDLALSGREIDKVIIRQGERRIDMRWVGIGAEKRWQQMPVAVLRTMRDSTESYNLLSLSSRHREISNVLIARGEVEVDTQEEVGAVVRSNNDVLLLPTCGPAADFLCQAYEQVELAPTTARILKSVVATSVVLRYFRRSGREEVTRTDLVRWLEHPQFAGVFRIYDNYRLTDFLNIDELVDIFGQTNWTMFDPAVWER